LNPMYYHETWGLVEQLLQRPTPCIGSSQVYTQT
jgi:hypothetical protein